MATSIHIETPPKVTVTVTEPGTHVVNVATPQAAVIEVAGLVPSTFIDSQETMNLNLIYQTSKL